MKNLELGGNKFWKIDESGKVIIDHDGLLDFLVECGFRKSNDKPPQYLRITNNIVRSSSIPEIKDHIRYIFKNCIIRDVSRKIQKKVFRNLVSNTKKYFINEILDFLPLIDKSNFIRDTKNIAYKPFKNGILEIRTNKLVLHSYKEFDIYVWGDQINPRDFNIHFPKRKGEFEILVEKVCNEDEKRINNLRSSLGYLLHSYKIRSDAKAIIFMDENPKAKVSADGGSGKSLVAHGIREFTKTAYFGKEFEMKERFAFQNVDFDTAVLLFDDLVHNFDFENVFTIITDGMKVERKYQAPISIEFDLSPKVLITTNHLTFGIGNSYVRRKHLVEFSQYFNNKFTPLDEFGHNLFDDWDEKEWELFDQFMVKNIMFYLKNGFQGHDDISQLVYSTSKDFVRFMDGITRNKRFQIKELFQQYIVINSETQISKVTFYHWIRQYLNIKGITTEGDLKPKNRHKPFWKSNSNTYILLIQ